MTGPALAISDETFAVVRAPGTLQIDGEPDCRTYPDRYPLPAA
jgi:hypothetical protein